MSTEKNVTPAQELRAAATTIRETAQSAVPGPWSMRDAWRPGGDTVMVARIANANHEDVLRAPNSRDIEGLPGTFEHIALWHPGVAELAASLLESVAIDMETNADCAGYAWDEALKLARAINGGA